MRSKRKMSLKVEMDMQFKEVIENLSRKNSNPKDQVLPQINKLRNSQLI